MIVQYITPAVARFLSVCAIIASILLLANLAISIYVKLETILPKPWNCKPIERNPGEPIALTKCGDHEAMCIWMAMPGTAGSDWRCFPAR